MRWKMILALILLAFLMFGTMITAGARIALWRTNIEYVDINQRLAEWPGPHTLIRVSYQVSPASAHEFMAHISIFDATWLPVARFTDYYFFPREEQRLILRCNHYGVDLLVWAYLSPQRCGDPQPASEDILQLFERGLRYFHSDPATETT